MAAMSIAPAASAFRPPLLPRLGTTTTVWPGGCFENCAARACIVPNAAPVPPTVIVSAEAPAMTNNKAVPARNRRAVLPKVWHRGGRT